MPDSSIRTVQIHAARFNPQLKIFEHLALKRSDNDDIYPGMFQPVTGTIDPGETAFGTAVREFAEETGLKPLKYYTIPYVAAYFNPYKDSVGLVPVFGALIDFADEVRLSCEHSEFVWGELETITKLYVLPAHREGARIFDEYVLSDTRLATELEVKIGRVR